MTELVNLICKKKKDSQFLISYFDNFEKKTMLLFIENSTLQMKQFNSTFQASFDCICILCAEVCLI